MKHFLVFGNHPRLALAEFRAVTHAEQKPKIIDNGAVCVMDTWNGNALMGRLAGTVKLGDIIQTLPARDCTTNVFADLMGAFPRGSNIAFGWTVLGGSGSLRRSLEHIPIALKKELKSRGIRSRWVTGKDGKPLSPAAVSKLHLTSEGYDVMVFLDEDNVHVGLTTHVQDADAWSLRDYGRPVRDEKAGMLPPKLARMMVNLADIGDGQTVMDPFCGNGTVLMEAALATGAAHLIGSDIEPDQTKSAERNTKWLFEKNILLAEDAKRMAYLTSDVRSLSKEISKGSVDRIVTEGTLGPPLRGSERQEVLDRNKIAIEALWKDSLRALHPLLRNGARLVLVWPSFRTQHGESAVDISKDLSELGYTLSHPLEGWEKRPRALFYHREGQKIARRIMLLDRE